MACCRRRRLRCWPRISASSSPPPTTRPSTTASSSSTRRATSSPIADEEAIEALLETPPSNGVGSVEPAQDAVAGYVEHILEHFGCRLDGLRIAVDCANGAFSAIAPGVFEQLGAQVTTVAAAPDGENINVGCGATDLGVAAGGRAVG